LGLRTVLQPQKPASTAAAEWTHGMAEVVVWITGRFQEFDDLAPASEGLR
jgi:hypothetical protein